MIDRRWTKRRFEPAGNASRRSCCWLTRRSPTSTSEDDRVR